MIRFIPGYFYVKFRYWLSRNKENPIKTQTNRILLMAAAALILIFAGFLVFNRQLSLTTDGTGEVTDQEASLPAAGEQGAVDLIDRYKTMVVAEDDQTVTIRDERGREVIIDKKPERVILLQNTLLDLWYLAGGTAVGRVSGTTSVPEEALDLPEVGRTTTPNLELLLAQNPDLVIMNAWTSSHVELAPILEENGIPYFFTGTSVSPYVNVLKALYAFSRLTGDQEAYQHNVLRIAQEVDGVLEQVPANEHPEVLVLFGSSKWVKAEMDNGLVGEMAAMLGAENVVENVGIEGESKIDFSLETIVESDPDYILVSVMGDVEAARDRLYEDMEKNEAWASLTAVQEGEVHFLPKELYLYKPNARYPEALQGLLEILHPEAE